MAAGLSVLEEFISSVDNIVLLTSIAEALHRAREKGVKADLILKPVVTVQQDPETTSVVEDLESTLESLELKVTLDYSEGVVGWTEYHTTR